MEKSHPWITESNRFEIIIQELMPLFKSIKYKHGFINK